MKNENELQKLIRYNSQKISISFRTTIPIIAIEDKQNIVYLHCIVLEYVFDRKPTIHYFRGSQTVIQKSLKSVQESYCWFSFFEDSFAAKVFLRLSEEDINSCIIDILVNDR